MRQKPRTAKGTMFITLEDEGGIANLVVRPAVSERRRRLILTAGMMGVEGRVQRQGIMVHVVVERLVDLTASLRRVAGHTAEDAAFPLPYGRGDEARRGGGPDARDGPALGRRGDARHPRPGPRDGPPIKVPTRDFRSGRACRGGMARQALNNPALRLPVARRAAALHGIAACASWTPDRGTTLPDLRMQRPARVASADRDGITATEQSGGRER